MKTTITSLTLGSLLIGSHLFGQGVIIPDYSFENITATVASPGGLSLGTNSGSLGAWSVSAAGLAGLLSSISAGNSLGAVPADGSFLARLSLPVGVGASAGLSQNLSQGYMPNSIYTLYVGLDHGGLVGLFGGGDLRLQAGGSTVASLSGNSLLSVLNPQSGMQTVSLSFQTGPTAPSGNIGIFFRAGSLAR